MAQDMQDLLGGSAAAAATGREVADCLLKIERAFPEDWTYGNPLARLLLFTSSTLEVLHAALPLLDTLSTRAFKEDTHALLCRFTGLLGDIRNVWDQPKKGIRTIDMFSRSQFSPFPVRATALLSAACLLHWTMQLALEQEKLLV